MARELASRGITVNMVAPGFIDTDMTAVLPDKVREAMVADIPLGKIGNTGKRRRCGCFPLYQIRHLISLVRPSM